MAKKCPARVLLAMLMSRMIESRMKNTVYAPSRISNMLPILSYWMRIVNKDNRINMNMMK